MYTAHCTKYNVHCAVHAFECLLQVSPRAMSTMQFEVGTVIFLKEMKVKMGGWRLGQLLNGGSVTHRATMSDLSIHNHLVHY